MSKGVLTNRSYSICNTLRTAGKNTVEVHWNFAFTPTSSQLEPLTPLRSKEELPTKQTCWPSFSHKLVLFISPEKLRFIFFFPSFFDSARTSAFLKHAYIRFSHTKVHARVVILRSCLRLASLFERPSIFVRVRLELQDNVRDLELNFDRC